MNYAGFILPLAALLMVFKWERDKHLFSRDYARANRDGFEDGLKCAQANWVRGADRYVKEAAAKLLEEYPAKIRVVERQALSYDFRSGEATRHGDLIELPTLEIGIRIEGPGGFAIKAHEWKGKWERQI